MRIGRFGQACASAASAPASMIANAASAWSKRFMMLPPLLFPGDPRDRRVRRPEPPDTQWAAENSTLRPVPRRPQDGLIGVRHFPTGRLRHMRSCETHRSRAMSRWTSPGPADVLTVPERGTEPDVASLGYPVRGDA